MTEPSADRKAQRKQRQLCRQVQEAEGQALAVLDDSILQDAWVMDVEPAPDASRLAVFVRAPPGARREEVLSRLERIAGYLRSEVAGAITRKRAPTLTFRVLPAEEEEDDEA
jgi:ribosome-binding factor A